MNASDPGGPSSDFRAGTVALLGWTNVGKSTLVNRLVGEKVAAVADVAQTTRHRIVGVCNVPGRGQIAVVDTPGIHRPKYRMNRRMVELARRSMTGIDLALLVVDAERGPGPGDLEAADLLRKTGTPAMAVLNKIDRVRPKEKLLPMMLKIGDEWGIGEVVPVSALSGNGCDALVDRILERLPQAAAAYPEDYLTDQPERLIAAEWVREQLLRETRDELPHATAVVVDRWEESEDGLLRIEVTVLVDRESQKGIVIGKDGGLLKKVGTAARIELEESLGKRIFLRIWVRVRQDWRNDDRTLDELGVG